MRDPNRHLLEGVVEELGPLRDEALFIGGAVVGLLLPPAGEKVRETDDVDCVVEVTSLRAYHEVEKQLYDRRWRPGSQVVDGDPLCRFRKGELVVDVMPSEPSVLGFAARWAGEAMTRAETHRIAGHSIRVISAPYFMVFKIDAFLNRGEGDYLASHDLEDLLLVVDGRSQIVEEVRTGTSNDVRVFMAAWLETAWERLTSETLPGVLRGDSARMEAAEARLATIRALGTAGPRV